MVAVGTEIAAVAVGGDTVTAAVASVRVVVLATAIVAVDPADNAATKSTDTIKNPAGEHQRDFF